MPKFLMAPVAVTFEYDEIERAAEFWKTDMQDALARLLSGEIPGEPHEQGMIEGCALFGGTTLGIRDDEKFVSHSTLEGRRRARGTKH
jgi:hypothetical protein